MTNDYLHNLLLRLGFSDFGARTAEFLILRPAKILLIVALAIIRGRRRYVSDRPIQVVNRTSGYRSTSRAATSSFPSTG